MISREDLAVVKKMKGEKESSKVTLKVLVKGSLVLVIIIFIILASVYNSRTQQLATDFLDWLQNNPALGAFAFIVIYIVATILFLPGLILTIGAGFVFSQIIGTAAGVFVAALVVWVGASIGASLAFLLGRFILRDLVSGWAEKNEKFGLIEAVVEKSGLKVTFLLRLSPIVPFNAFNYLMGLTSVRFRDYCLAHFGIIPGTLAYCFVGTSIGTISELSNVGLGSGGALTLSFIIVGTVIAFIGMLYVAWVAKKEFDRLASEIELQKKANSEYPIEKRSEDDDDDEIGTAQNDTHISPDDSET